MIKREVFDKIGLLDEQFGLGYHEDVDFCIRAEDAGYKLLETGSFPIYHRGRWNI
jgi:GT2 family glycosyltransferase